MANHLIIGLGGTGGGVLREFRKRVYSEYGTNKPEGDFKVDYIYLDSDERELMDKDDQWRYLGYSVKLDPANLVNIHGMGAGVLNNLNAFPGIKAFVSPEDRELLKDRQVSDIITTGIGGQRRRFGRMLFANNLANAAQEEQFTTILANRLDTLINASHNAKVNIHIVAGLAGGTGSGTLIDVITQIIRTRPDQEDDFPITLYLYVPEMNPPKGHDVQGFYQSNGYAALKELNALSIGKYHPLDVSPMNVDHNGNIWRLPARNGEPFKKAYLYTDHNSKGAVLPKGAALSAAVADFIFQKTNGTTNAMERLTNAENEGCQPDNNEDGKPIHSRNFMTFGIKRILYPEADIRGYIGYSASLSVVMQLLYNNWVDNVGYQILPEENAGLGLDTEVKSPKFREEYMLSDNYLTLQSKIPAFENTDNWKTAREYWTAISSRFVKMTAESGEDSTLWKNAYVGRMETTFDKNFRESGVKRFYETQSKPENVKRFARVIANHIESKLFNEWINGSHGENNPKPQSLQKVKIILEAIRTDCTNRIPEVNQLKSNAARHLAQEVNPAVERAAKEFDDVGGIRNWAFDTRKRKLNDFAEAKKGEYIIKTQIEGYNFETLLLEELSRELTTRISGLNNLIRLLSLAGERMAATTVALSIPTKEQNDEVRIVERLFEPEEMAANTEHRILRDAALQQAVGQDIRTMLKNLADESGKGRFFGNLYTVLGGAATFNFKPDDTQETPETAIEIIRATVFPDIQAKLEDIAQNEPEAQFLRVNVLQKIRQMYPGDEALKRFIAEMVTSARPFAEIGQNAGAVVGSAGTAQYSNFVQLCLPDYEDNAYRNKFIEYFGDAVNWNPVERKQNVATNARENELVIIYGTSNLPVRMLRNVRNLKEKYLTLTSGAANVNSELNKLLLHTESLGDDRLPDLFSEDPGIRARRIRGYAMCIHTEPELIQQQEDVNTGKMRNVILTGKGLKKTSTYVGTDMEETARMMEDDHETRAKLTAIVEEQILPKYRRDDEREKMRDAIEEQVVAEILQGRCKNNPTHPMFEKYCKAAESFFAAHLS